MWNYRVVRKKNVEADATDKEKSNFTYTIHEAYYDKNGQVGAITQNPIEPFGENIEELRHAWVMMAEAFGQPILDYDNIPEPGYEREQDPMESGVDEILEEVEANDAKGIPWEHAKRDMEEKCDLSDEEGHEKRVEEERIEKEKIHGEAFIGTPTLEELINKIYSEYRGYLKRDRTENPWRYKAKDELPGTPPDR